MGLDQRAPKGCRCEASTAITFCALRDEAAKAKARGLRDYVRIDRSDRSPRPARPTSGHLDESTVMQPPLTEPGCEYLTIAPVHPDWLGEIRTA